MSDIYFYQKKLKVIFVHNNQKTLFLFLLLFIHNSYPMIDSEESDHGDEIYGSAYREASPLCGYAYSIKNEKRKINPTYQQRTPSPTLGKYGSQIPEEFIPSLRIFITIEILEKTAGPKTPTDKK